MNDTAPSVGDPLLQLVQAYRRRGFRQLCSPPGNLAGNYWYARASGTTDLDVFGRHITPDAFEGVRPASCESRVSGTPPIARDTRDTIFADRDIEAKRNSLRLDARQNGNQAKAEAKRAPQTPNASPLRAMRRAGPVFPPSVPPACWQRSFGRNCDVR